MFCTECGKPNPGTPKFCRSCGAATVSDATAGTTVGSMPEAAPVWDGLRWAVIRDRAGYRSMSELQKFDMWFDMGRVLVSTTILVFFLAVGFNSPDQIGWVVFDCTLSLLGFYLYLLPTKLAIRRTRPNRMAIFAFNFFLGWTLVGWAVSLSWALTSKDAAS